MFHDAEEILRLWREGKLKDLDLLNKNPGSPLGLVPESIIQDSIDSGGKSQQNGGVNNANGTSQNQNQSQKTVAEVTSHKIASNKSEKVEEVKKKKGCCSLM